MKINLKNEKLLEFYQFIAAHYVLDGNKNLSTPSGAIYSFHPKFCYKKEVVDNFFAYMIWKNQKEKSIEEIAIDNNLSYNKELQAIILGLCPKNKKVVYAKKVKANSVKSTTNCAPI